VRPGDVVVSVAGQPVTNTAQLLHRVAALKPGSEAALALQRGSQQVQVTLTVGQRPKQPAARRR
ncbi:PDZ domain-containing protein, partial [Ideonella sp.]|uniref:PDZ domain-containing protein n=1 Tax=Ideonella sp. TaxID=1929293 RepID=UPI002B45E68B